MVKEIQAHQKEIWSMKLLPNLTGLVTGRGDLTVKFWTFELIVATIVSPSDDDEQVLGLQEIRKRKVLSLLHRIIIIIII